MIAVLQHMKYYIWRSQSIRSKIKTQKKKK